MQKIKGPEAGIRVIFRESIACGHPLFWSPGKLGILAVPEAGPSSKMHGYSTLKE